MKYPHAKSTNPFYLRRRFLLRFALVAATFLLSQPTADAFVSSRRNALPPPKATTIRSQWQRTTPHRRPMTARHTSALQASLLPYDFYLALQQSSSLLEAYGNLLRIYPLTTKAVTAAVLSFLGDAIAQYSTIWQQQQQQPAPVAASSRATSITPPSYDLTRGLSFLIFGAVYTGAFQHVWFDYLSAHVSDWGESLRLWGPNRAAVPVNRLVNTQEWWTYFDVVAQLEQPPSDAMLAAAKVAVNQFLMVPAVYMPLFFFVTGNFDWEQAVARAQSLYVKLLRRNYVYWLPVQFCQFFWLPAEWQIPFLSVASLVWTVILSSIGSASSSASSETDSEEPLQDEPFPEPIMATSGVPSLTNWGIPSMVQSVSKKTVKAMDKEEKKTNTRSDQDDETLDAATTTDITEEVSLQDVREALVSAPVHNVLENEKVGSAATGLTLGLVASAADDGALGELVSTALLPAQEASQVGTGVAVTAALSALVFWLGAARPNKNDSSSEAKDIKTYEQVTSATKELMERANDKEKRERERIFPFRKPQKEKNKEKSTSRSREKVF